MMKQYTDEELVAKYKASLDHQFLTELFTRHSGVLYRSALRTTKNHSNAEDVLQTAFIKMISDLSNYKGSGSVIGWMLQVVIHTCYEKLRSEKSRLNRERKVMSERIRTTSPQNDELKEMIETHLNKLPEIYKVPITLKIMEGLSIKEVSDALKIPEKTIRSQIDRGLEKLKVSLQNVGITASVISIGDMLQAIQKPLTPEVFTSNQYFISLFQKKSSMSSKLTLATGSKSSVLPYLMISSILIITVVSMIIAKINSLKNFELLPSKSSYQKWNFENTSRLSEYSSLGLLKGAISIVESMGVNNSNVLRIDEDSILEIDISKYQLPIKISYLTDIKINTEKPTQQVGFLQMIFKGNYKSDQKIIKISGIRENMSFSNTARNSNAKLNYFGKWIVFESFIDENCVDFYMNGQRNYYFQGASQDNKKIYLSVKRNTLIDDLQIESIDKSTLPDKSKYENICNNLPFLKDKEYYDIDKDKLGLSKSLQVKPYLRLIRPDFFSLLAGTDNETIYPILSNKKVEWIKIKQKMTKNWEFESAIELADFKAIKGAISLGTATGVGNSNCMEVAANSIFEIDISSFQLPLKISYRFDFSIPEMPSGKSSKGIVILKGNYQEGKNIFNFVKFRPQRQIVLNSLNKNDNFKYGFTGEWNTITIYVSENCLDLNFNDNRTGLMLGKSNDNKKLYFDLKDKYLIENFMIECIEDNEVPDFSSFKAYADSFKFEKGSRNYFALEKEKPPLNLDKNSLLELAIFDKETAELIMGINQIQKTDLTLKDLPEYFEQR